MVIKDENGDEITESAKKESSSQKQGKADHKEFARLINNHKREGVKGRVLDAVEKRFKCKFLAAEVDVWGWSVKKSKATFYSGFVDAIAFRHVKPRAGNLEGKSLYEVLIVDWKTTAKVDKKKGKKIDAWWDSAKNFRDAIYQCLVYRELLVEHLKRNDLGAQLVNVGVMLVPYHQSCPGRLKPGLCVDFKRMKEKGLLAGLEQYRWVSDKSEVVHTIIPSESKLFKKEALVNKRYMDTRTKTLKKETLLKHLIHDNATVEDLLEELDLRKLKVTEK